MTREQLIEIVARHPQGLTTRQVAESVNGKFSTIGAALSKLADYGYIVREHFDGWRVIWKPKA